MVGRVDQHQLAATATELGEQRNEHANTGAVDVADTRQIDGAVAQLFTEVLIDALQQLLGIGAADQVAGEAHEEDAVLDGGISFHSAWSGGGFGAAVAAHAVKV